MNEIINWITSHNALMIQSVFSIVMVLVVVYVYRIYFVSSGSNEASEDIEALNKKITQLIQQQAGSTKAISGTTGSDSSGVLEKPDGETESSETNELKKEIAKLKEQLNESEKKIFELAPTNGSVNNSVNSTALANAAGATEALAASSSQVKELTEKVQQLEARLSEYDIIADDIAELSQLRADNIELKKKINDLTEQLASAQSKTITHAEVKEPIKVSEAADPAAKSIEPTQEAVPAVADSTTTEPPVSTAMQETTSDTSILESVLTDLNLDGSTSNIEELVANQDNASSLIDSLQTQTVVQDESTNAEASHKEVDDEEKNLMSEFEKSTRKEDV